MPLRIRLLIAVVVAAVAAVAVFALFRRPRIQELEGRESQQSGPHSDNSTGQTQESSTSSLNARTIPSSIRFSNVSHQTGIDFQYYGNPSAKHYMTEQNGGGVALFDFDGDGQLDIFLVNGSHFDKPSAEPSASNRLFRAGADWQYEDVTEAAGLQAFGFGMGCTAADYNNDGFIDLYVTYFGRNRLWCNNGDGTFQEVSATAGVDNELWGTSTAFADLDNDGNLDLYVVNYVTWRPTETPCYLGNTSLRIVCSPNDRPGQRDALYRNLGQGRFEDVGETAGIAIGDQGKGLAVAIVDFDQDHRPDIYVANDMTANFLFQNSGNMQFREVGVVKGAAYSEYGVIGAGMGIGCDDYNRDGRLDLCISNFRGQVNDVFANLGENGFICTTTEVGIDRVSRESLGFGIILHDFDLDGWADVFVANGHIWDASPISETAEYEMYPHLLRNDRGERFIDASPKAGQYFQKRGLGRAVAMGDLDSDGDMDLVVSHLNDKVAILRNDSTRSGNSLRIRLIGTHSPRQPLGVGIEARVGSQRIVAHVPAGESFQASQDDRVLIPIGDADNVDELRVFWADGRVEVWRDVAAGALLNLIEGTGQVE